jgi:hypothetical protein
MIDRATIEPARALYVAHWDYATIAILGLPEGETWEPVRQWFLRWFDIEDEAPVNDFDSLVDALVSMHPRRIEVS